MDAGIINFIEELRTSLYDYYDLPAEERRQAEAMFARIEQFGSKCRNRADFEEKFANLTMSREFYGMLSNFAAYVKPIFPTTTRTNVNNPDRDEYRKHRLKSIITPTT